MEDFVTTKTVVGEPIHVGGTTVLPLCDVTFGVVASTKNEPQKHNGGGGMGGKMVPSAMLIIKEDGSSRIVNVKDEDSISRLVGMIPDIVDHFRAGKETPDPGVQDACDEAKGKTENF